MRRLFDHNPTLGITRWFHGHGDGSFTIETQQDVGAIVEVNKRQFNAHDGKRFGKGFMHHVARIPISLAMHYWLTGDDSEVKKFLRLSDNKAWRTHPGTI